VVNSLISAGCVILGEVKNSILAPGVVVESGAVVSDSVIIDDCLIQKNAVVDLAIMDKRVDVGRDAVVGCGTGKDTANEANPTHLYTGITLIGKDVEIPEQACIGRNCIVAPSKKIADFPGLKIPAGSSI